MKQLTNTHGTGNVSAIAGEALKLGEFRFTGEHYASRRAGSLVVIAETTSESGRPDAEVLNKAAQVAAELPEPRTDGMRPKHEPHISGRDAMIAI